VLLFCVGCALLAVRRARQSGDERLEILLRGLVVGMGGYLVTLMFISEEVAKIFWVVLALGPVMLAVASSRLREREAKPESFPATPGRSVPAALGP
jgi:peptidoglycan/LPS O-acetylase OafA/YrhL